MKKGMRTPRDYLDSDQEGEGYRTMRASSGVTADNHAERRQVQSGICRAKQCSTSSSGARNTPSSRKLRSISAYRSQVKKHDVKKSRIAEIHTDRSALAATPNKTSFIHRLHDLSQTKHSQNQNLCDSGIDISRPGLSPIRRVTFGESQEPTRKSRSILEALSPFKRRANDAQQRLDMSLNYDTERASRTRRGSLRSQDKLPVPKDNILAGVTALQQQLASYLKQGKIYRNKSYGLVAEALQIICSAGGEHLSKYSRLQGRQAAQLKLSLKSVDRLYRQFEGAEPTASLEELASLLRNKLIAVQNQSFDHYERLVKKAIGEVTEDYEVGFDYVGKSKLAAVEKQNLRLNSEVQSYERRMNRQLNRTAEQQKDLIGKEEQSQRKMRERIEDWQKKLSSSESSCQQYRNQLEQASASIKQLELQIKTLEYQKTSLIKSFEQERKEVQHAKNALILEELNRSKLQYEQHLHELQRVSDLKELRLTEQVRLAESALEDQAKKLQGRFWEEEVAMDELRIHRTQVEQQRAENHSLRLGVRALEEENYVQWTALKDIKILSTRLNLFGKFSRIYDDIRFNDVAAR